MGDDGRVVGDPTEVLTRSGGSSYVSLTGDVPTTEVASEPPTDATAPVAPRRVAAGVDSASSAGSRSPIAVVAGVLTGSASESPPAANS